MVIKMHPEIALAAFARQALAEIGATNDKRPVLTRSTAVAKQSRYQT
jgi:hypothetical protein